MQTNPLSKEKRQYERVSKKVRIEFFNTDITGETIDLSLNGAKFSVSDYITEMTRLRINLHLNEKNVECGAIVVRSEGISLNHQVQDRQDPYCIAVYFDSLSSEKRLLLAEFLGQTPDV